MDLIRSEYGKGQQQNKKDQYAHIALAVIQCIPGWVLWQVSDAHTLAGSILPYGAGGFGRVEPSCGVLVFQGKDIHAAFTKIPGMHLCDQCGGNKAMLPDVFCLPHFINDKHNKQGRCADDEDVNEYHEMGFDDR